MQPHEGGSTGDAGQGAYPPDAEPTSQIVERLPWDSSHFGVSIGRVVAGADPARAVGWARDRGVQCLYLLCDLQEPEMMRAAIAAGFVLTDVRLTFERALGERVARGRSRRHPAVAEAVRRIAEPDLGALLPIADAAHVRSRFYADPRFDRARVAAMYREWLRASLSKPFADWALTEDHAGAPVGYITGRIELGGVARIGLLGVDSTVRGRGVGSRLVDALLLEASRAGCGRVTVVTQGANIEAQRLYQRAGFRTRSVHAWFHWWA